MNKSSLFESPVPRYLVDFHPKRVPHVFADVLVIGGGIAGLRTAMGIDPRFHVLVVTKDALRQSNSNYAQGGIAGVLDPDDRFESHVEDTMLAGGLLCNRDVVEMVVREAPEHIRELISWGTHFDEENGELMLGREGGHSHHRIVHALGDATGREVMRAMIDRALNQPNVQAWPNTFTIDLVTDQQRCQGALVESAAHGRILIWARHTVLATGGAGQLYRETTNPLVATGDGHALAYRAGAELADMEFMQFHPTVLYIAGSSRSLITEAMRGEGAILVDKDQHRFMPDYDERAELAPRDVVSRSIVAQMEKTRHPCVYLDVSHLDAEFVTTRFPGITQACAKFGIDVTKQPIPVRPGAHYMIGGLTVDGDGQTSLPGLFAAGESTSSGLHGANRLASNSLLEGLVYGARAARKILQDLEQHGGRDLCALPLEIERDRPRDELLDVADIRNSLQSLMWRAAGVRRQGEGLLEAAQQIDAWCRYVLPHAFSSIAGWELQNLLTVARMVIETAYRREESRGVHNRDDFPETDDGRWGRHLQLVREEAPS